MSLRTLFAFEAMTFLALTIYLYASIECMHCGLSGKQTANIDQLRLARLKDWISQFAGQRIFLTVL